MDRLVMNERVEVIGQFGAEAYRRHGVPRRPGAVVRGRGFLAAMNAATPIVLAHLVDRFEQRHAQTAAGL
jgi:hypothetical protein